MLDSGGRDAGLRWTGCWTQVDGVLGSVRWGAVQRLHQYTCGLEHNQCPPSVCQDSLPMVRGWGEGGKVSGGRV